MTVPPSTPDLDSLLAHSGWVRALARNLVGDLTAADDVEQQAWVTALQRPPSHGGNLRSWWSAVVRSSAGQGWREQKRRREVASSEVLEDWQASADDPHEVAEKLETYQRLSAAVSQLSEPYRSAIYLRYVEELPVREVAKRQRVPVATAQSHIQRGLGKLRATLSQNLGAQWRNRCLVFALPTPAAPWFTLGPAALLAMNTKTILGVAAGFLALASLTIWTPWQAPEASPRNAGTARVELPASPSSAALADSKQVEELHRTTPGTVTRETQVTAVVTDDQEMFEVQVLDAQTLEPAPFAVLHLFDYSLKTAEHTRFWRQERPDAITRVQHFGVEFHADEHGLAAVSLPTGRYELVASESGRFAYHGSFEKPEVGEQVELLLRPQIRLHVLVHDEQNQAVAGVEVGFAPSQKENADFSAEQVTTDEFGKAVFRHLETRVADQTSDLCTVALLVPSAAPQVQEVSVQKLTETTLTFLMPQTGSVAVQAQTGDGTPLRNGTPIILQLENDAAHLAAAGKEQFGSVGRFQANLGQSVVIAYVRDGIALFPQVGVGTKLAVATYDNQNRQYAVTLLNGPALAGERVPVTLRLGASPEQIILHLQDSNGQPLAEQHLNASLSWHTQSGKSFGIGLDLQVQEDGRTSINAPSSLRELRAALLTTAPGGDYGMLKTKPSRMVIGVLVMSAAMLAEESLEWTVAHGGPVLVAGHVVDQDGNAFANCALTLSLREANPIDGFMFMDSWDLHTDANGYFHIEAPLVVAGFEWSLAAHVRDHGISSMGVPLPFSAGNENVSLVVPRSQHFAGRLLLDDLSQVQDLQLLMLTGPAGESGTIYYNLEVDPLNGRFQSRRIAGTNYTLELRARGTMESLGSLLNLHSIAEEQGEVLQLPDWNLRGKFFTHHLTVTTVDGQALESIVVRLAKDSHARTSKMPSQTQIISQSALLGMTIGAAGYRDQEVLSEGSVEVELQHGLTVRVDFSQALPEQDGLLWHATFVQVRSPGQPGGISWNQIPWQVVEGKSAQLSVPSPGKWVLLLRAVPTQQSPNSGFEGIYNSANLPMVVEVDQLDVVLTANLNEEELERVIAEALASKS